jgi:hypothetical protein
VIAPELGGAAFAGALTISEGDEPQYDIDWYCTENGEPELSDEDLALAIDAVLSENPDTREEVKRICEQ